MRLFAFDIKIIFQISSFILVYEGVRTTLNGVVGDISEGTFGCGFSYVGRCVLREWVVRECWLDGCFGECQWASTNS